MMPILIIDDDAANRAMFSRALRDVAPVEIAEGGAEGITKLAQKKYSVVLLDFHMPGVDGVAVLGAINEPKALNKGTPVYVITADTSEDLRKRAVELGAACVVTKPVQLATLVSFVKTTLRTAEANRSISPDHDKQ